MTVTVFFTKNKLQILSKLPILILTFFYRDLLKLESFVLCPFVFVLFIGLSGSVIINLSGFSPAIKQLPCKSCHLFIRNGFELFSNNP